MHRRRPRNIGILSELKGTEAESYSPVRGLWVPWEDASFLFFLGISWGASWGQHDVEDAGGMVAVQEREARDGAPLVAPKF